MTKAVVNDKVFIFYRNTPHSITVNSLGKGQILGIPNKRLRWANARVAS